MVALPREYVDVDFEALSGFRVAGDYRIPGCKPREDKLGEVFPRFREAFPVIPRENWQAMIGKHVSLSILPCRTLDQNGEGTCTWNATAQAVECTNTMQFGSDKHIMLSPVSGYKLCANGPNTGSSLTCALTKIQTVGILPTDTSENRAQIRRLGISIPDNHFFPDCGYYTRYPSGWENTAALFRAYEIFDLDDYDDLVSALLYGFVVVYARQGHCILAIGLIYDNGRLYVVYLNSWGSWGSQYGVLSYGCGFDSESVVRSGQHYGMFVIRATHVPPELFKLAA